MKIQTFCGWVFLLMTAIGFGKLMNDRPEIGPRSAVGERASMPAESTEIATPSHAAIRHGNIRQDQDQDPQDPSDKSVRPLDTSTFMTRKLDSARNIVSGLAMEDFELIAKSAQDLKLLSLESQWELYQTIEYVRMSQEFRDSSGRLQDAAHAKNLDGATLAYFEVTLSCVRCHKYIRQNADQ